MANNRLYLCCITCLKDPEIPQEECILFMFKYYPSTGWYITTDNNEKFVINTQKFLDSHIHPEAESHMYGEFISIFEDQIDPMHQSKREICNIIMKGLQKLHAEGKETFNS